MAKTKATKKKSSKKGAKKSPPKSKKAKATKAKAKQRGSQHGSMFGYMLDGNFVNKTEQQMIDELSAHFPDVEGRLVKMRVSRLLHGIRHGINDKLKGFAVAETENKAGDKVFSVKPKDGAAKPKPKAKAKATGKKTPPKKAAKSKGAKKKSSKKKSKAQQ